MSNFEPKYNLFKEETKHLSQQYIDLMCEMTLDDLDLILQMDFNQAIKYMDQLQIDPYRKVTAGRIIRIPPTSCNKEVSVITSPRKLNKKIQKIIEKEESKTNTKNLKKRKTDKKDYLNHLHADLELNREPCYKAQFDLLGTSSLNKTIDDAKMKADEMLQKMTSLISESQQSLSEVVKKGSNVAESIIYKLPIIIFLGIATQYCITSKDPKYGRLALAMVTLGGFGMYPEIRNLVNYLISEAEVNLHEAFGGSEEPVGYNYKSQAFEFKDASGFILMLLASVSLATVPGKDKIRSFVSSCVTFTRAKDGLADMVSWVLDIIMKAYNYIVVDILKIGDPKYIEAGEPIIDRWCIKVLSLVRKYRDSQLVINKSNSDLVYNLHTQGHMLLVQHKRLFDNPRIRSTVTMFMAQLKKLSRPFEQANISGIGPRMEPLTFLIRGAPGIGKSYCVLPMINKLLLNVLDDERKEQFKSNYMDFVYIRNPETEFWDNYHGQEACFIDEFGMVRDYLGREESEFTNAIRISNMFPYMLHIADIEEKGKKHMTSSIFGCATNIMGQFETVSLYDNEALRRRFEIDVAMYPKKEYSCPLKSISMNAPDRRLNYEHPIFSDKSRIITEIYEFQRFDYHGKPRGPLMSYDELMNLLTERWKEKKIASDAYLANLQLMLEDPSTDLEMENVFISQSNLVDDNDEFADEELTPEEVVEDLIARNKKFEPNYLEWDDSGLQSYEKEAFMNIIRSLVKNGTSPAILLEIAQDVLDRFSISFISGDKNKDMIRTLRDQNLEYPLLIDFATNALSRLKRDEILFSHYSISQKVYQRMCDAYQNMKKVYGTMMNWIESKMLQYPVLHWLSNNMYIFKILGACLSIASAYKIFSYFRTEKDQEYDDPIDKAVITFNHVKEKDLDNKNLTAFIEDFNDFCKGIGIEGVSFSDKSSVFIPQANEALKDKLLDKIKCYNLKLQAEQGISMRELLLADHHNSHWVKWYDTHVPQNHSGELAKSSGAKKSIIKTGKNHDLRPNDHYKSQVGHDGNAQDLILKVVTNNMYEIINPHNGIRMGIVTFITKNYFIMNNHFRDILISYKDDYHYTNVKLVSEIRKEELIVPMEDFVSAPTHSLNNTEDVAIVCVTGMTEFKKDILKYWVTEKQRNVLRKFDAKLVAMKNGMIDNTLTRPSPIEGVKVESDSELTTDYVIRTGYSYLGHTTGGTCGALLVIFDPSIGPGKLLGIHTAGSINGSSLSSALVKEDLEEYLSKFSRYVSQCNMDLIEDGQLPFKGNFEYVGKSQYPNMDINKTQIVPSRLYGKIREPKKMPACIRYLVKDGEVINLKYKAIEKFGHKDVDTDEPLMRTILDEYFSFLGNSSVPPTKYDKETFSFEQAVCGVDQWTNPINRKSSAGYPYSFEKPGEAPGKTWWFGEEGPFQFDFPQTMLLKDEVLQIIEYARVGVRSTHIVLAKLKDELRKINKIMIDGDIRCFMASPMSYIIAFRMLFMGFFAWFMSNNIRNGSCVGINVYSEDWDYIAQECKKFSNKMGAGDFKGYDTSQIESWLKAMLPKINEWYNDGPENAKAREILWMEVYNARVLVDVFVFMMKHALPSGHPGTVFINCMFCHMVFRYAYAKLHPYGDWNSNSFDQNVLIKVYGDDHILAFKDEVVGWFNQQTIHQFMPTLGLGYSPEDKSAYFETPFRELVEITFLKRGFRYESRVGRYVAPLELDTILEMPMWTKRGALRRQIECDNVDNALIELSLHEPIVWQTWSGKIINASQDFLGYYPKNVSRVACIHRASNKTDIW